MTNRLRLLAAVLLLSAGSLSTQAQTKLPPRRGGVMPRPRLAIKPGQETPKDGVRMKEGKIMVTELGHTSPLTADRTLISGTKITTTGLITTPEGATTQLQEGDEMSLSGRVTTKSGLAEQDSLRKLLEYDTKLKSMTKQQRARLKDKQKADEAKAKRLAKRDKARG